MMLNPAARVLWRARDIVQLELGAEAVLIEGADVEAIHAMIASRAPADAHAKATSESAAKAGFTTGSTPRAVSAAATEALTEAGYLWSTEVVDGDTTDRRLRPPVPRLAAELTALAARHGGAAADLLQARRRACVAVHGTGRAAAHIAALLAAAGVGRLHIVDGDLVRLQHAVPGGVCPADEGHRFADAVTAAVHRAAPEADTTPPAIGERPDLVVLAIDEPIDGELRASLHSRGCTHLVVRLGVDHGAVGPLVIPGWSSCTRCADLHRRDRDPAWTALAVQLAVPRRHGPASDVTLATIMAGVAAGQALAYLDGGDPPTTDGTLEMHLPDWRLRRRSWPGHPDCDCRRKLR
jgi:hypothetical protein